MPASTPAPRGLRRVNSQLVRWRDKQQPSQVATLDMDATVVRSSKSDAPYAYKGYEAYQPINIWWDEHRMVQR